MIAKVKQMQGNVIMDSSSFLILLTILSAVNDCSSFHFLLHHYEMVIIS